MKQLNMKTGKRHAKVGQSLAEYGLILSLVAVVSIAGLNMLGNSISSQFNNLANAMSNATGAPSGLAVAAPPASGGGGGGSTPSAQVPAAPASNPTTSAPTTTPPVASAPAQQTPALTTTTQAPASAAPAQSIAVSDGQQGAMLQCSGNDPTCAGNVDQGSTWGW